MHGQDTNCQNRTLRQRRQSEPLEHFPGKGLDLLNMRFYMLEEFELKDKAQQNRSKRTKITKEHRTCQYYKANPTSSDLNYWLINILVTLV